MEFKEAVTKRYATRAFTRERVPEDKVDELLDIIRFSPSAINLQPWRVKIIRDQATRDALASAMFNQPQAVNCSHLLIFCTDIDIDAVISKVENSMKNAAVPEEVRNRMISMARNLKENFTPAWLQQQTYFALANAVNGAKSLGFDSCPMTGFDAVKIAQVLHLPGNIVPTALCPIGYAAEPAGPKTRLSRKDILI